MDAVTQRSYERTVRVGAPLWALYAEMDSVERIARFLPQLDRVEPVDEADDTQARCFGVVSIGPLCYRLAGSLEVQRVNPPRRVGILLRASRVPLELEGGFEFTRAAAEETTVRYAATIRSAHPLMRRIPSALTGVLEEHVDAATDLAALRGRQYVQAERLLGPDAVIDRDAR
jgi:carbon monoxide dehydrogenase subunit G